MIISGKFFLFLIKTVYCDPSSELSRQDDSDTGSQHMVLCRINKNYPSLSSNTHSYPELCTISVLLGDNPMLNMKIRYSL